MLFGTTWFVERYKRQEFNSVCDDTDGECSKKTPQEQFENNTKSHKFADSREHRSAQASEKATSLARLRYQYGVSDFLTVLDAERTLLQAQDQLAQSETNTATALVTVYEALGGGWQ